MLVPVQSRPALRLGVIAVPDADILESDSTVKMCERKFAALRTNNVVSRNMGMTSVDARTDRHNASQQIQQLGDLLKCAAQRKLRPRRIFNQNCEPGGRQI